MPKKGYKMSDEHKAKISAANKGRKVSEATRRKLSESLKGKVSWSEGIPMKEEIKKKISAANKGKIFSAETKKKISIAKSGVCFSDDHKKKLSEAKIGKTTWNKGKKASATALKNMSIAQKNRIRNYSHSEETKIKIGEGNKGKPNAMKGKKRSLATIAKNSGVNHWRWKGGVSTARERARKSREFKEWRKKVYKRDIWHCAECGVHCTDAKNKNGKTTIQAHHIIDFVGDGNTPSDYDVNNGITLCNSCHLKLHMRKKRYARIYIQL